MNQESQSLFSKAIDPFKMAGMCLAGAIVIIGFMAIARACGIQLPAKFPWLISGAFTMVFAIFNSVFIITAENTNKYWGRSLLAYIAFVISSGLLAYLVSGMSPGEAGSFKAIYIILTFGYLVFISIMGTIRFLLKFLDKEQEKKLSGHYTKKRKRKNKI